MKCPKCNGTGIDDDRLICYECDGTGEYVPFDADIELDKLYPTELTNEQWLRLATTEQLVMFLAKQKCDGCNDEPYDDNHGTCKYCMTKKTEQIKEWLKQPHKEVGK